MTGAEGSSVSHTRRVLGSDSYLSHVLCYTGSQQAQRLWHCMKKWPTLSSVLERVKWRVWGRCGEFSAPGGAFNFPKKLAIKCLTVIDRSCFGGAKASLKHFFFKFDPALRKVCLATAHHRDLQEGKKSFFGTLSFSPQLFHSVLPDSKDPSLCGACTWAALSSTTAPEGPGQTP